MRTLGIIWLLVVIVSTLKLILNALTFEPDPDLGPVTTIMGIWNVDDVHEAVQAHEEMHYKMGACWLSMASRFAFPVCLIMGLGFFRSVLIGVAVVIGVSWINEAMADVAGMLKCGPREYWSILSDLDENSCVSWNWAHMIIFLMTYCPLTRPVSVLEMVMRIKQE